MVDIVGHLSARATRGSPEQREKTEKEVWELGQVHLDLGRPGPVTTPWKTVGMGNSQGDD